jgi:hypothetical protein
MLIDQFHAGEPAVVLLETEQRAGEVEEDGANAHRLMLPAT